MTDRRPRAVLAMAPPALAERLFTPATWAHLARHVRVDPGLVLTEFSSGRARAALADADLVLAGWGCPRVDAPVLDAAPKLAAIIGAIGDVGQLLDTAALRGRPFALANAGALNALPVAEYTLGVVLLALREFWGAAELYRERGGFVDREIEFAGAGSFRRTVGIVGASRIGRRVLELLRPFDVDVLLHDPTLDPGEADRLGVRSVGLDELMAGSAVVSLHAPVLPATVGMIDRGRLALLPDGATFVNTARGALVDHDALADELRRGRIRAVLDVTEPEPLPRGHALFGLPGLVLTPHIAGSMGTDLHRMGEHVAAEAARFAAGEPFASGEPVAPR